MGLRPLRTNQEVLAFAADHAPTRACQRAIERGNALVIQKPEIKGWVVDVMAKRGQRWQIQIRTNEEARTYSVSYIH